MSVGTRMLTAVSAAALVAITGVPAQAAAATRVNETATVLEANNALCVDYAQDKYNHDDSINWSCAGGSLGVFAEGGDLLERRDFVDESVPQDESFSPMVVIDPYTSQVEAPIFINLDGVAYQPRARIRVVLYNRSPTVTQSYTAYEDPIGLTWELRLRQDIPVGLDSTIFDYDGTRGTFSITPAYSETADRRAFTNIIPRNAQNVFLDMHNFEAHGPTDSVGIFFSLQSDRLSCATRGCTFPTS